MNKTRTIPLTRDLDATIILIREDQGDFRVGDNVLVRGRLALPCEVDASSLQEALYFGSRVTIDTETLVNTWGSYKSGLRFRGKSFMAETWAEAEADAEKYWREQLIPLQEALAARAATLAVAKEEPERFVLRRQMCDGVSRWLVNDLPLDSEEALVLLVGASIEGEILLYTSYIVEYGDSKRLIDMPVREEVALVDRTISQVAEDIAIQIRAIRAWVAGCDGSSGEAVIEI